MKLLKNREFMYALAAVFISFLFGSGYKEVVKQFPVEVDSSAYYHKKNDSLLAVLAHKDSLYDSVSKDLDSSIELLDTLLVDYKNIPKVKQKKIEEDALLFIINHNQ